MKMDENLYASNPISIRNHAALTTNNFCLYNVRPTVIEHFTKITESNLVKF